MSEQLKAVLQDLACRAKLGEFDGTGWEIVEWAESPKGKATFEEFGIKL